MLIVIVKFTDLFQLRNNCSLRGHSAMIHKQQCSRRVKQDFFTNRVVKYWNCLPDEALHVGTVDTFKKHVDKLLNEKNVWWGVEFVFLWWWWKKLTKLISGLIWWPRWLLQQPLPSYSFYVKEEEYYNEIWSLVQGENKQFKTTS